MVLADFFGVIEHVQIHLLAWCQRASSRLNLEDLLVKDLLLEGLILAGSARISPCFHLDL